MTIRSVLLGLMAAILICASDHFNLYVMGNGTLVGHYFPPVVFGGLALFLLLVNPLLHRVRRGWVFSASELAVVTFCALVSCFVVGGLMSWFPDQLVMPYHLSKTRPDMRAEPYTLGESSVRDWPALLTSLASAQNEADDSPRKRLQAYLSDSLRKALSQSDAPPANDPALRDEVIKAFNQAVEDPGFHQPGDLAGENHSAAVRALLASDPSERSTEERMRLNRMVLDASFPALQARKVALVERAPRQMLVDRSVDPDRVVGGYAAGLGTGSERISFFDVPWSAYVRPLAFWVPIILCMALLVTGVSLVVHRQWSQNEHLPYPIAEVTSWLMPREGQALGKAFSEPLFWIGFVPVLLIHANNYMAAWWGEILVPIELRVNLNPMIMTLFPWFDQGFTVLLNQLFLCFSIVGMAYFIRTDVALCFGLSAYVYCIVVSLLAAQGIFVAQGGSYGGGSLLTAGAFAGMFVAILYVGRQHYLSVLQRCVGLSRGDDCPPEAIWGARLAGAAFLLLVFLLAQGGLAWPFAAALCVGAVVLYVVCSRVIAETGIFLYGPVAYPHAVIWAVAGGAALGPDNLLIMMFVSLVLFRTGLAQWLMPLMITGLKIADNHQVKVGRLAGVGLLCVAIGIAVAFATTVFLKYQYGAAGAGEPAFYDNLPRAPFNTTGQVVNKLEAWGSLEASETYTITQRFGRFQPDTRGMVQFSVMFFLILAFMWLQIRFPRWPMHPVLFLAFGSSWVNCWMAGCLLLGCLVKYVIVKYGGSALYEKLKPFMVGMIVAEVMASILPLIIGGIYYALTETPPTGYAIYPN